MKRLTCFIVACVMVLSLTFHIREVEASSQALDPNTQYLVDNIPYKDVDPYDWYIIYVYMVHHDGIMQGQSKEVFAPKSDVSMAEIATVAARIHARLNGTGPDFTAKQGEAWYMPYVRYCYKHGIYRNGRVDEGEATLDDVQNWNRPANRAEVAAFLAYCDDRGPSDWNNPDYPLTDIPDVDENTMYWEEILTLYRRGVAMGDEKRVFHPYSHVNRAEVAAFVTRMLNPDFRMRFQKG